MTGEKYFTVENLAACYAVGWAVFVANPFVDFFLRYPALYKPMRQICDYESIWAAAIGLCGLLALYFSFTNRRLRASAVMFFVFICFAVLFFAGDYTSPGWFFFGLIAVWNLIHWRFGKWNSAKVLIG